MKTVVNKYKKNDLNKLNKIKTLFLSHFDKTKLLIQATIRNYEFNSCYHNYLK